MDKRFWKKDWLVGVVVGLLFWATSGSELMQSLERKAYDLGVQATSRIPSDKIAVIAIDDQSIANLGRWPWPREIHAKMLDTLNAGHAKVVGYTAFFFEPQVDAGLEYIHKIAGLLGKSALFGDPVSGIGVTASAVGAASEVTATPPAVEAWTPLDNLLVEAAQKLDNDRKFGESLSRVNDVLLAMFFELGEPQGRPDRVLPDYVSRNRLADVGDVGGQSFPPRARAVLAPVPVLGSKAMALGHLNTIPDVDGAVRREPLIVEYFNQYYPSLSLMLAAKSLNLGPGDIRVEPGGAVLLGNRRIVTDPASQMYTYFYQGRDGRAAFPADSFFDVYTGKIAADKYRDKIVLIGASAAGIGSLQVTPVSPGMAPVETLAHSVSSILQGDFFIVPAWAEWARFGVIVLVTLYLALLLPRLKALLGAIVTIVLLLSLLATHFVLMTTQAIWLQLMLPALLLLTGHLLLTTKHFLLTEQGKRKSDSDSAESNRMLGLAFQGQGQLDIAFDKFRKVPLDDSLMEVLYNLGLDFERKRQFNKAESVFRYMAEFDPKFRDLEQRLRQAREMSETVILGGGGRSVASATMALNKAGMSRPMLGRYEIEKELGKGAMGVVYQGKDPKIGRIVAIKTMALSQEFEGDELQEVKERFFREAETAGRLNHPNIVSIYDAGEEHDLAYIAMEFLRGKDLVPYTKPDSLLPLPKVMSLVARVADALDYAHKQHIVHRDIKPANIMYDPETDVLKVTDFGIARITDSSKTRTGMVLGTPSYMSPEQLAGKKIDGASDLFSLAVSLYQLACGKLPFEGDSMAQLMYRISSEPPTDIRSVRPDIPPCLAEILDKALAKDSSQRFASGADMAEALRKCAAGLQG